MMGGEERRAEERKDGIISHLSSFTRESTIYMHDASLCMMGRCFLFFYQEGFVLVMVAKAQQSKTVMGNVVLQCNKKERDRDMKRAMTQRDKKRWWRKRMQVDISGSGNNKYYRRVALGCVPIH